MKSQEYLNENYSKLHPHYGFKSKDSILGLYLQKKEFEGFLDFSKFPNLTGLDCYENKITYLDLSENEKLRELRCQENELTVLNLRNNKFVKRLDCWGNKITSLVFNWDNELEIILAWSGLTVNLNTFSNLNKLKRLELGSKVLGSSNCYGSLKNLENCKKLEWLSIVGNKNIKGGLEFLPLDNLRIFECQGTEYQDILRPYDYDIKAWKLVNHPNLITTDKEKLVKQLNDKLEQSQQELKKLNSLSDYNKIDKRKRIARLENKVSILETQNNKLLKKIEYKEESEEETEEVPEQETQIETNEISCKQS